MTWIYNNYHNLHTGIQAQNKCYVTSEIYSNIRKTVIMIPPTRVGRFGILQEEVKTGDTS